MKQFSFVISLTTVVTLSLGLLNGGDKSANPTGGAPREQLYTFNYENVLGTSLEVKVGAASLELAEKAEAAARREIDRQAKILSAWDPESEFSRWMRTAGQPVRVSHDLFTVLRLFDEWRERTGGALDASAEVITRLWKNAEKQNREPSPEQIRAAVAEVKQIHWKLDAGRQTATHLSSAPIALNSFAKSYIVGHAADCALASEGVHAVVVNIGGDLVVRGAWTEPVNIADPKSDAENSEPVSRLRVQDRAVATSGNYRRGVEVGGRHYSHIVDPRTGMPADDVISSTVVARDPADAGALATAFSVLRPEESRRLAATVPGAEYLLVMKDGKQIASRGWPALVAAVHPNVLFFPAVETPAPWNQLELTVTLELARFNGQARRPYVAIWVEDQDKFPVRTIALWREKPRYVADLKAWYRSDRLRALSEGSDLLNSVSSATRPAGKYTVNWDGKDNAGKFVKPGKYSVYLEVAREHGTYQLDHQEMDFNGAPQKVDLPGGQEVTTASLDYHRLNK
jgi:thiamine biosynthesis lipoprotein ApbE